MKQLKIKISNKTLTYCGESSFQSRSILGWGCVYLFGEIHNVKLKDITPEIDFSTLFGRFVLLFFDQSKSSLRVVTDRYGLYPFYFIERENKILLGERPANFGAPLRNDYLNLVAELLAFNQPLGEQTYWEGVSRFAPASVTQFFGDTDVIKTWCHWDKEALIREQDLRLEDHQDSLLDLFLESCDTSSRDHSALALTLSGGIDSRLILAGLLQSGRTPQAWTTGVVPNRAITHSHNLAMLSGIDHHVIPLGDSFISQYPHITLENIDRNSGLSLSSEAEARWLSLSMPQGVRLLHGAFGELYKLNKMHDFSLSNLAVDASRDQGIEHFAQKLIPRFELRRATFKTITGIHLDVDIRDAIYKKANKSQALSSAAQLGQWLYIEEYLQKVAGMSMLMWSEKASPVCPLSYPKFMDLLLRIRPSDRRETAWPLYALKKLSPKLATYPDSNTNSRIGASKQEVFLKRLFAWVRKKTFRLNSVGEHMDTVGWIKGFNPGYVKQMESSYLSVKINTSSADNLFQNCITRNDSRLADALIAAFMLSNSPIFSEETYSSSSSSDIADRGTNVAWR